MSTDWQSPAATETLRARAALLRDIRTFLDQRGVLEVETPLLGQYTVTDPQMDPVPCGNRYLQTSPEYAMKRLLAGGSGPIYQVCKAFRGGECGDRHNPEFTLLEWYRPGFDQHQLMAEVAELVMSVSAYNSWEACSYRDLFLRELSVDPLLASDAELRDRALAVLDTSFDTAPRDIWLDLMMSHVVEPSLVGQGLVFVYDYPESQAALARLRPEGGVSVGERFELYLDGMELANGYCELCDATEQEARFESDRRRLREEGLEDRAVDPRLIAALRSGLPRCSGVALGLDRLLMVLQGGQSISDVLSFDWNRA